MSNTIFEKYPCFSKLYFKVLNSNNLKDILEHYEPLPNFNKIDISELDMDSLSDFDGLDENYFDLAEEDIIKSRNNNSFFQDMKFEERYEKLKRITSYINLIIKLIEISGNFTNKNNVREMCNKIVARLSKLLPEDVKRGIKIANMEINLIMKDQRLKDIKELVKKANLADLAGNSVLADKYDKMILKLSQELPEEDDMTERKGLRGVTEKAFRDLNLRRKMEEPEVVEYKSQELTLPKNIKERYAGFGTSRPFGEEHALDSFYTNAKNILTPDESMRLEDPSSIDQVFLNKVVDAAERGDKNAAIFLGGFIEEQYGMKGKRNLPSLKELFPSGTEGGMTPEIEKEEPKPLTKEDKKEQFMMKLKERADSPDTSQEDKDRAERLLQMNYEKDPKNNYKYLPKETQDEMAFEVAKSLKGSGSDLMLDFFSGINAEQRGDAVSDVQQAMLNKNQKTEADVISFHKMGDPYEYLYDDKKDQYIVFYVPEGYESFVGAKMNSSHPGYKIIQERIQKGLKD